MKGEFTLREIKIIKRALRRYAKDSEEQGYSDVPQIIALREKVSRILQQETTL